MATIPNILLNGTTADAVPVMGNFTEIYTNIDRTNVAAKTGSGSTFVFQTSPAITSPTITGNLNLNSSANLNIYSDGGVTLKFKVDGATGSFGIPSGQKFLLDGTALNGDTYIYESAANIVDHWAGGNLQFTVNGVSNYISIPATRKFYFDGGGDTYINESSANTVDFQVGGSSALVLRTTNVAIGGDQDLILQPNKNLYLDGGTNDYLGNSGNGQNDLYANGILALRTTSSGFVTIPQGISGTLNFAGGTTYNLSGGGNITARLGHFSVTLVGTGIDVDVLNISGVQTGAGKVNGIYFSTTDGQLDGTTMRFDPAYTDTSALGAFYGRIPITIDGVGTKYISLYS